MVFLGGGGTLSILRIALPGAVCGVGASGVAMGAAAAAVGDRQGRRHSRRPMEAIPSSKYHFHEWEAEEMEKS